MNIMRIKNLIIWAACVTMIACGPAASERVLKTYPDGKTQEVELYSGTGNGQAKIARIGYYRNGATSFEETYKSGVVTGYKAWWPEGQLKQERFYDGDEMTAEKSYDSDGVEHITQEQIKDIITKLADYEGEEATAEDVAVVETTAGTMIFRFYTDIAPIHANNFKRLANFGFYDGTTFHRIIPGFVIQGGDINSRDANRANDGNGGPGYTIPAEFNPQPHMKGSLAMARSQDPNSAGSQFYIALGRLAQLDNQYTVFGELIDGMEIMEAIAGATTDAADNPISPQRMIKVRVAPAASD